MRKLLMDDIPDSFIERQMNDSRYISKLVKGLLSNIVREKLNNGEYEQEAVSKNLISCNGSITDRLKKDWGMNDVWNSIILPRFQRLNRITGRDVFTTHTPEGHEIPVMPLDLQKGFNKKRVDHRHHAMDAIVIACATRDHVNLLNNEAAHSKKHDRSYRHDLQRKLRRYEKIMVDGHEKDVAREFLKPWDSFTTDAKQTLENIVVSFKQNLRVINKTINHIQHFDENGKKVLIKQEKGDSWAIRKSMHKDTGWGEVNLRLTKEVSLNEALKNPKSIVNREFKQKVQELLAQGCDVKFIKKYVEDNKDVWSDIDVKKIVVYYYTKETKDRYFATRFLSDLVTYLGGLKKFEDAIKKIDGITDTGIQKILKAHLHAKDNNPELAFSADGIDEMNRNIVELNGGKPHKPIYKVRRYECGNKYPIGQIGCKAKKFVEADKGTNLFFAVFVSEKLNMETGEMDKVRSYLTIPLNVMIDCQKKFGKDWKNNSPNDLVYLPTKEEIKNGIRINDKERIYKFVSCTSNEGHYVPARIASPILQTTELGSNNKSQRAWTNEMIKETCIPIKVDRLGNVIELNGQKL